MSQEPRQLDVSWSRANIAAIVAMCVIGGAIIGWRLPSLSILKGLPSDQQRIAEASQKVDPNTAPLGSLLRLPGIGPGLAEAIIQYRQAHGPGAFKCAKDLENVRGIGPAGTERLEPLLEFSASSQPAPAQGVYNQLH